MQKLSFSVKGNVIMLYDSYISKACSGQVLYTSNKLRSYGDRILVSSLIWNAGVTQNAVSDS